MKVTINKMLGLGLGVAALCATALPAAAGSFTQPGGTMGAPLGANPPPGLYFANSANWGMGVNDAANHTQALGVEVPAFIWSTGYSFLGASYAASAAFVVIEPSITSTTYQAGVFNPILNPIALSWNLGNGFFVSFQEVIYTPLHTNVSVPGASFEQRASISYLANDWVISANNIFGLTTGAYGAAKDSDYYNLDWTVAHKFGAWELGVVGYASFDLQNTVGNAALGKGRSVGIGGLLGYGFSNGIGMTLEATHQIVSEGDFAYGRDDTRVWTSIVIPIWNPTPPAPKPLVAKY